MAELLTVSKENIKIDSGMSEASFGKTNLASMLSLDQGMTIEFDQAETPVDFTPWHFSKIETASDGKVSFCGKGFEGISLKKIFESGNASDISHAVLLTVKAISKATNGGYFLPAVGAGAIIVGKGQILFLPKEIFESCCNCLSAKEKSETNDGYLYKGAGKNDGLYFLRAVLIYYALCKKPPFTEIDEQKRQNDIIDAHFLPLEYAVNGVNMELSTAVNNALSASKNVNSDMQKKFPLGILQQELGIQTDGTYKEYKREPAMSQTAFEKNSRKFFEKKHKKVEANRFVHKNKTAIICVIAAIFLAVYGISSYMKRLGNLPTTKGLTAEQTVQQFYSAFHMLDTELATESSKGAVPNQFVNEISTIYVTTRARAGYGDARTYTPERWLNMAINADPKSNLWICGLTNVVITSENKSFKANLHADVVKRNEKPAVVQENATVPSNGEQKTVQVEYYKLLSHGEKSQINIQKYTDSVVCTFRKNRWLVTDITSSMHSTEEIILSDFQKDFALALEKADKDSVQAANILRTSYPWIPDSETIISERKALMNDYKNLNF